jgi:hypothetical protein
MVQRKTNRYPLSVPAVFHWVDQQGVHHCGAGFTRDIGTVGTFILCSTLPRAETKLELEILLPPSEAGSQGVRLSGQARVIRVQAAGQSSGFAAAGQLDLADGIEDPFKGGEETDEISYNKEDDSELPRM